MKKLSLLLLFVILSVQVVYSQDNDNVLIVVTSHNKMGETGENTGFWLAELTHPYYVIKDAGYKVVVASIEGEAAPIDPRSIDTTDVVNKRFYKDADLMAQVLNSRKLSDLNPSDYKAILFSGGHGAMWDFPGDSSVNEMSKVIYEQGGVVGAVCHGPAALVDIKLSDGKYLIDGKKVASFTNEEETMAKLEKVVPFMLQDKLTARGGSFVTGDAWKENAVLDQRVVTGQNPQSAHKVGELIVEVLKEAE